MLARIKSCSGPLGLVAILVLGVTGSAPAVDFLRGDINGDGAVSVSDAKHLTDYLFQGRHGIDCMASADVKEDGKLNITDSVLILQYLIFGDAPPPAPFPAPGAGAQVDLSCDSYGGGSPLVDPNAELRVLDATAPGGDDRRATIRIVGSSSNAIAGLYGVISSSAFGSVNNNDVKDLTGTADRPFGGADVVAGRLHFGFLPDVLNPVYIPAGEDQEFIEITFCLPQDTPAGQYPMTLESGELIDAESCRAIHPALSGGVLTVASQASGPDRCAEEEPPPRPVVNVEFRLENVSAGEDRKAAMPFVLRASAGVQGYSYSADFDEETLDRLKESDLPVVIHGEIGTGKEVVARTIHAESRRFGGPFLVVDFATVPSGLIEVELFGARAGAFTDLVTDRAGILKLADGGTVLFDEIAGASPEVQAKLLRALAEGRIRPVGSEEEVRADVRFLFSTSRDLEAEARAGRFREDLLYRIKVITVEVPPLRERREDLPALVDMFLGEGRGLGPSVAPRALERLREMPWPGNVRELKNVISRLTLKDERHISAETLDREVRETERTLFPPGLFAEKSLEDLKNVLEREYLTHLLARLGGDTTAASRLLGVTRKHFYRRCRQVGLRLKGKGLKTSLP